MPDDNAHGARDYMIRGSQKRVSCAVRQRILLEALSYYIIFIHHVAVNGNTLAALPSV